LKHAGLLDDEQYIKSIIDTTIQYEYDGPYKVREKLIKKGANISLVDHYLDRYTDEVQKKKLRELLSKECKYTMKKPLTKMNQTFKQRYITKGYSIEIVDNILEEFKEDISAQIDEEYLLLQELRRIPKSMFEKKNKQKLTAKLMRLGYSYSLIKEKTKGGNDDENYE
jgi:regulatory protein